MKKQLVVASLIMLGIFTISCGGKNGETKSESEAKTEEVADCPCNSLMDESGSLKNKNFTGICADKDQNDTIILNREYKNGYLLSELIKEKFNNSYVVATMLIVVGVLFIVIENRHKGKKPQITKISQMGVPVLIWIGVFQMLAMIPGTSRSGATIIGALALGVSRTAAADFTFFLAIPAMAGASLVKLRHFGFDFTGTELGLLLLGCVVSFVVAMIAIKFFINMVSRYGFKVFGYYRIALGLIILALIYSGQSLVLS
jgi:hypothetical protein